MEYQRGDIYYIYKDERYPAVGREMYSGRPGIIVSNDTNNEQSDLVQVVYLTTRPKRDSKTHVTVRSTGVVSTACCEQIFTVDKCRISNRIGACTEEEMECVNAALAIQLDLHGNIYQVPVEEDADEDLVALITERDLYKKLYEDLIAKMVRKVRKYNDG